MRGRKAGAVREEADRGRGRWARFHQVVVRLRDAQRGSVIIEGMICKAMTKKPKFDKAKT